MGNTFDILARGIFNMLGLGPEQIREQQIKQSNRRGNSQPIRPRGQTSAINRSGNARNFKNPAQSANRAPTLDPISQRGGQATPPNRPPNGFGASRGQLRIPGIGPGNNPGARPAGKFTAPSVPPRMGTPTPAAGPDIPVASRRFPQEARAFREFLRADRAANPSAGTKIMNGIGAITDNANIGRFLLQGLRSPRQLAAAAALWGVTEGLFTQGVGDGTLDGNLPAQNPTRNAAPTPQQTRASNRGATPLPSPSSQPEVQLGRDDPFAPIGYNPPAAPTLPPATPEAPTNRQALRPESAPAAPVRASRAPSRAQVVRDAYDALRARMNRGEITPDEFRRQGLAMHREYFKKSTPPSTRQPQMTGEGIPR